MSAFKDWLNLRDSKSTPVDADVTYLRDSEDSGASKKLTLSNLWLYIKGKADTVYSTFSGAYADLSGKPTLGSAAALDVGTTAGTVAAGDHTHSGYAASSHSHAASDITSGTMDTARLGSGTANSTTFLRGDQTWATPSGGSPGGSDTQVQFNDGGSFGGDSGLTYDKTTKSLSVSGSQWSLTFNPSSYSNRVGLIAGGGSFGFLSDAHGLCIGESRDLSLSDSGVTSTPTVGLRYSAAGMACISDGSRNSGNYRDLKLRNLIATGNLATGAVAKTASYTATANDGTIECDATSGAITITLPAASGIAGRIYVIKKTDSSGNAVTVDANASETIDGATTVSLASQYSTVVIQCNAAGTAWIKLASI